METKPESKKIKKIHIEADVTPEEYELLNGLRKGRSWRKFILDLIKPRGALKHFEYIEELEVIAMLILQDEFKEALKITKHLEKLLEEEIAQQKKEKNEALGG